MLRRVCRRYGRPIFSGAMLFACLIGTALEASWIVGVNAGLWLGVFIQDLAEMED